MMIVLVKDRAPVVITFPRQRPMGQRLGKDHRAASRAGDLSDQRWILL